MNALRWALVVAGFLLALAEVTPAGANVGVVQATGDFDGDGFQDLVLGRSSANYGAVGSGGVEVLCGGSTLSTPQIWHQGIPGVLGAPEASDYFGSALAAGDFNGDSYDDLVVGVPYEDIGSVADAGAINVLYGSATGLTASGNQLWSQDSPNVAGGIEQGDGFGTSLVTGDFDGDGYADLVIGVPFEDLGSTVDAGTVQVLYGSATGLATPGNRFWNQESIGILGVGEANDRFGSSLAADDFNADGRDDLAVGVPYEAIGSETSAGLVAVLYGSASGIVATGNQIWTQGSFAPNASTDAENLFGFSLAAGDFDGDGYPDLAAGAPQDDYLGDNSGSVAVFAGSGSGLAPTTQGHRVLHGGRAASDYFGFALAAGDFDDDGFVDLAMGAPAWEPPWQNELVDTGAKWVSYGRSTGLEVPSGEEWIFWRQGLGGVPGILESADIFGLSLTAGDFNGDGYVDLVVGVPGEDSFQGAVNLIFGSAGRLTGVGSLILN